MAEAGSAIQRQPCCCPFKRSPKRSAGETAFPPTAALDLSATCPKTADGLRQALAADNACAIFGWAEPLIGHRIVPEP